MYVRNQNYFPVYPEFVQSDGVQNSTKYFGHVHQYIRSRILDIYRQRSIWQTSKVIIFSRMHKLCISPANIFGSLPEIFGNNPFFFLIIYLL